MFSLFKETQKQHAERSADAIAVLESRPVHMRAAVRPALSQIKLEKHVADARQEDYLKEYAELAILTGVAPPDLGIESLKAILVRHDIPIFDLHEVVAYMDAKAEKESNERAGWEWMPLRERDKQHLHIKFGRAPKGADLRYDPPRPVIPGSDFYEGPSETTYFNRDSNETSVDRAPGSGRVYNRTIPLHALRRVATIEKEHPGNVAFFVSDYALAPHVIYPDPFLMAVIPNPNAANGTGRFVIDFWDEPGFGIEQMLNIKE